MGPSGLGIGCFLHDFSELSSIFSVALLFFAYYPVVVVSCEFCCQCQCSETLFPEMHLEYYVYIRKLPVIEGLFQGLMSLIVCFIRCFCCYTDGTDETTVRAWTSTTRCTATLPPANLWSSSPNLCHRLVFAVNIFALFILVFNFYHSLANSRPEHIAVLLTLYPS